MKYPPYPCARNYLTPNNWVAADGTELVYNTSTACTDHKTIQFIEPADEFALVNIIPGDALANERLRMQVTPDVSIQYTMTLVFEKADGRSEEHTSEL